MRLYYNPQLRSLARELRNQSTLAEILLWAHLRSGQRGGFDFDRQKPIDEYIVDFFSMELMLAVEIDGDSHRLKGTDDDARQLRLETLGIRFLRFDDALVKASMDSVLRTIDQWIEKNPKKR